MATTKRQKAIQAIVQPRLYTVSEAIGVLKQLAAGETTKVKFSESFDVSINLGIDTRKSDQAVRGASVLPHGTGRSVRVAVFAQGEQAEAAKAAGAEIVGLDDLAESVKQGNMDFDVVIATPDTMRVVGKLGQVLGPRGLMPNPKVGTVTTDVAAAVKSAKGGQVRFRADKAGIVHCSIGKANFEANAIQENLQALLAELRKQKPSTAKGVYMKKITLSTTMGPGLTIEQSSLEG